MKFQMLFCLLGLGFALPSWAVSDQKTIGAEAPEIIPAQPRPEVRVSLGELDWLSSYRTAYERASQQRQRLLLVFETAGNPEWTAGDVAERALQGYDLVARFATTDQPVAKLFPALRGEAGLVILDFSKSEKGSVVAVIRFSQFAPDENRRPRRPLVELWLRFPLRAVVSEKQLAEDAFHESMKALGVHTRGYKIVWSDSLRELASQTPDIGSGLQLLYRHQLEGFVTQSSMGDLPHAIHDGVSKAEARWMDGARRTGRVSLGAFRHGSHWIVIVATNESQPVR